MVKLVGYEFIPKTRDMITRLQYDNLRNNFSKIIDNVLGFNYYNYGMDVYTCDDISTEHIINKFRNLKSELRLSEILNIALCVLVCEGIGN